MKISNNSPVVIMFVIIASVELLLNTLTSGAVGYYFSSPGSFGNWSVMDIGRSVLHVFGHASYDHLVGNMMFILLLGPILEEKYGSLSLLFMILVTAVLTAFLNAFLFTGGILGASGVVFMMIILSSFTNVKAGTFPLTFVMVIVLYFGKEFYQSFSSSNVSHFAHILGGCFGGIFGLLFSKKAINY